MQPSGFGQTTLEEINRTLADRGLRLGQPLSSLAVPFDWAAYRDSGVMVWQSLRGAGSRKQRLFLCACCRKVWDQLTDSRSRQAVEMAERCADGGASVLELQQYRIAAFYAARETGTDAGRLAVYAVAEDPSLTLHSASARAIHSGHHQLQEHWLRDLLGDPACNPRIAPAWRAWNGGAVVKLARGIYDEHAFDGMPVLADALEEAGCTHPDLLSHCRQPGEHVRGCWVLDRLLGKE